MRCAQGHSKHEMWMRLCDLCAKHPEEVTGVLKVRQDEGTGDRVDGKISGDGGRVWNIG